MRIIAFSDSHGDYHSLERVVLREPYADIFIFLGDGEQELSLIKTEYNQKVFAATGHVFWMTRCAEGPARRKGELFLL